MLKHQEQSSPMPIPTYLKVPKPNMQLEFQLNIDVVSPAKSSIVFSPRSGKSGYPEIFIMDDYSHIPSPRSTTIIKTPQSVNKDCQSSFVKKLSYESIQVEVLNCASPQKPKYPK